MFIAEVALMPKRNGYKPQLEQNKCFSKHAEFEGLKTMTRRQS